MLAKTCLAGDLRPYRPLRRHSKVVMEVMAVQLVQAPNRVEKLGAEECWRLLATQEVGRLGFLNDGNPDVLPVNYVVDGDAVVFATSSGSKLWGVTRSPVAFEVDAVDAPGRTGWSVVIHGLAREITSIDSATVWERLTTLSLSPWPGGERQSVLRLAAASVTSVTGRRVSPAGL